MKRILIAVLALSIISCAKRVDNIKKVKQETDTVANKDSAVVAQVVGEPVKKTRYKVEGVGWADYGHASINIITIDDSIRVLWINKRAKGGDALVKLN